MGGIVEGICRFKVYCGKSHYLRKIRKPGPSIFNLQFTEQPRCPQPHKPQYPFASQVPYEASPMVMLWVV